MCFTEFIGYTCGHTATDVLRVCPLTTRYNTNPICTHHGRRPVLAQAMCPSCQRILHGRAVLILEWEHHWMHERGVCGCPVVFPDLVRPRIVGRGQPYYASPSEPDSDDTKIVAKRRGKGRRGKSSGKWGRKNTKKDQANHGRITAGTAPGEEEDKSTPGSSKKAHERAEPGGVSVQISSFFAVEWVAEHRRLHNEGACHCPADFSFYQTPDTYESDALSAKDNPVVPGRNGSNEWYDYTGLGVQVSSSGPQVHQGHDASQQGTSSDTQLQVYQPSILAPQGAQVRDGQPARSPGAIYQVDPAHSMNPLYNYVCTEGGEFNQTVDIQPVEYPKPDNAPLPLVGLPIGAGPEGPPALCHVGAFEDCVLRRPRVPASRVYTSEGVVAMLLVEANDTRATRLARLLRKSASIGCIAEVEAAERGRHPAGERPGWDNGNAWSEADECQRWDPLVADE
ncbi:hypothetical protein M406DRAFT_72586 [Cryphonectria parasitica EP155]|uniref:Uncharacterized protein n=1 Tax=Cryphonectria parasitica (strain ATCC 38755 / EP155) TaxID=660469 RepID=A0A9P4XXH0_CRYP1|nr:uncharacterized protein M406DRAFT_72586 [Cryphonectria parasitica EP155]KAF3762597.1 hypothetical protein M406DRAFT_72586 [Cryphonectria parasitica EP155]